MIAFWALLFAVSLPNDWKGWRYSREVKPSAAGLSTFICPREVYDHPGVLLGDLRLVDSHAREAPFALQKGPQRTEPHWESVNILSNTTKGKTVEMVLDTQADHRLHNMIRLDIPDQDFLSHVDVAVSDQLGNDWRLLRESMPIYRYLPDSLEGNQTIVYPSSYSRYIQLKISPQVPDEAVDDTLLEKAPVIKVQQAQTGYDLTKAPDWLSYGPIFSPDISTSKLQTWWRSDALTGTLPITGIRVNVSNKEFHRAVKISASPDGRRWTVIQGGDIFRVGGDRPFEQVIVPFPETTMRYWRIQFFDNLSPPLVISKIELLGMPIHVVFQAASTAPYRILYGNGHVNLVDYPMSQSLDPLSYRKAAEASVGDEEETVFDQRGPWFWAAVGGGGLALIIGIAVLISLLAEDSESHTEEPLP